MRASEPLKSKRFAISLFAWSTAFLSSTLLISETMSKEGMAGRLYRTLTVLRIIARHEACADSLRRGAHRLQRRAGRAGNLRGQPDLQQVHRDDAAGEIEERAPALRSVREGAARGCDEMRIIALLCTLLIPGTGLAAVTYSFDWYCSNCAKLGVGSNGREGPYGSGSACEGARTSMAASLATRGCGAGRCFNPQPCVASGQPDLPPPPVVSVPRTAPATAKVPPYYDARPDRVRRADEV